MRFNDKAALLCALAIFPAVAAAKPKVELEVGGGALTHFDPLPSSSPAFTARVGLDLLGHFTPSVRTLSLTPLGAGRQAWAVLAELRAHTQGLFQLNAGVGLGLANAIFIARPAGTTDSGLFGAVPYLTADVGVRVTFWRMWVGINLGVQPYSQQWSSWLNLGFILG